MLPILSAETYLEKPLADLSADILSARKQKVGDIRIRDLAATAEFPYGVYVLADQATGGTCLYVGRVSSRSFAERVPMHFDPRDQAWMNQFTRKLSSSQFNGAYADALLHALEQYIVFIGFRAPAHDERALRKAQINRLESLLQMRLEPTLNSKRGKYDNSERLRVLLPSAG